MPKRTLTEDEYIAELNRRLREHEFYRPGMAFVPTPADATGHAISGSEFKYKTTDFDTVGVYAQVARQISDEFDLRT